MTHHVDDNRTFPVRREEFEAALRRHVLDVWYPRCTDHEHGGFLCEFDRRWQPRGPHGKLLEFQARQTWFAAAALKVYPDDPRLKEAATHGFHYLKGPLWDPQEGGWYHRLDCDGKPLERGTKHAHGIAYALAACSAIAAALDEPAARELAQTGFEWLDTHARDHLHGTYHGLMRRDGRPLRKPDTASWPAERDQIGTPLGYKDVNVHNDLLEALVWLYGVWPDERILDRIAGIVEFLAQRMTTNDGGLRYLAGPDGTPASDYIQYGHNFQAAYRVLWAYSLLGERERGAGESRRLLDFALNHAQDKSHGGYRHSNFDSPGSPPATSKQWWIQMECIHALCELSVVYPDERYLFVALSEIWTYVNKFLFDDSYAGLYFEPLDVVPLWRRGWNARFAPSAVTRKGSEWKYVGHEGNALLAGLRRASMS